MTLESKVRKEKMSLVILAGPQSDMENSLELWGF
jgi:hypothetical protein